MNENKFENNFTVDKLAYIIMEYGLPTSALTDKQIIELCSIIYEYREVDYSEYYNINCDHCVHEFLNDVKSVIKKAQHTYTCELEIGDIYNLRLIELVVIKDILSKLDNDLKNEYHKLSIDLQLTDCLVYMIGLL